MQILTSLSVERGWLCAFLNTDLQVLSYVCHILQIPLFQTNCICQSTTIGLFAARTRFYASIVNYQGRTWLAERFSQDRVTIHA